MEPRRTLRPFLRCGPALAAAMGFATPALAAPGSPFPGAATASVRELEGMRGGFTLPNGMDISIGLQIDTMINGALVLRTVLSADEASALSVFAGGGGEDAGGQQGAVATGVPGLSVRLGSAVAPTGTDQPQILLTPNGPAVSTPSGMVQLKQNDDGSNVVLNGNGVEIRHMIGAMTGAIVANAANNRAIDTVVTVNIDLQNSAIPIGNMIIRLEPMILGAASRGLF